MDQAWKKISGKTVYESPYVTVQEDRVQRPDGSDDTYYLVRYRPGVAVVAYDGQKLLLVNQYRYPLQKRVWSFVAGGRTEDGPLEDAKKELKEESGYTAGTWTHLGSFANNPSITDQHSDLYLAEDLTVGDHDRESGELDMEHRLFSFEEVEALIERGELSVFDIADYYLFKTHIAKRSL